VLKPEKPTYLSVNRKLIEIWEQLSDVNQDIGLMNDIKGDSVENLVKVIEESVVILRKFVDLKSK
jgi:hypothetical protein